MKQLAVKYDVNEKTIRRDLEGMRYVHKISKYKTATIQMDTTYWGRDFGLMVIKDALRGVVLWHKYVHHETIVQYVAGVEWLKRNGFKKYGAVIDGMKGLPQALKPIRVQMCQFHQMLIVRRYLPQDPDLDASQDLLNLINTITKTDKESFIGVFEHGMRNIKMSSTKASTTRGSSIKRLRTCVRGYAAPI